MTRTTPTRTPLIRESWVRRCANCLFLLVLAAMVLGWGTEYKVSLYNINASSTAMPAKLCTRASEAVRRELDHKANDPLIEPPVSLFESETVIATFEHLPDYFLRSEGTDAVLRAVPFSGHSNTFLRPPPAPLLSVA